MPCSQDIKGEQTTREQMETQLGPKKNLKIYWDPPDVSRSFQTSRIYGANVCAERKILLTFFI